MPKVVALVRRVEKCSCGSNARELPFYVSFGVSIQKQMHATLGVPPDGCHAETKVSSHQAYYKCSERKVPKGATTKVGKWCVASDEKFREVSRVEQS